MILGSFLDQFGFLLGVVVNCPFVGDGPLIVFKMDPPDVEATKHIRSRDIVPALPDAGGNPLQGDLRRT
jgi:hypothetical protein